MKEFFQSLLAQQKAEGFPAFAGTDVQGHLPLRESLLNDLMRAALRDKKLPVQINGLRIVEGNRLVIDAAITLLIRVPLSLTIRLEATADIAAGQKIVAHLEGAAGLLSRFVGVIADKLPSGVTITNQQVFVDVRALLAERGLSAFAPLIRQIRFATQPGALFIDFHLNVPQAGETIS